MLNRIEHASLENFQLKYTKRFIKSNHGLNGFLEVCKLTELQQFLQETRLGLDTLKMHLSASHSTSSRDFHELMNKIQFSKQEERIIGLNYGEYFLHSFKKLGEYILGIGGMLSMLIMSPVWTLYFWLGATGVIGTSATGLDFYSFVKKNHQLIYQKKLLNLETEIIKEINKKLFLDSVNQIAFSAKVKLNLTPKRINSLESLFSSLTCKMNNANPQLLKQGSMKSIYPKIINEFKKSGIGKSILVDQNNESFNDKYKALKNERMTFFQWFNARKGSIVKEAVLGSALWKALGILGAYKMITGTALLGAASAFLATPVGMGIVIGVTTATIIGISAIKIYEKYKKAKRNYALEVARFALQEEEKYNKKLFELREKANFVSEKIKQSLHLDQQKNTLHDTEKIEKAPLKALKNNDFSSDQEKINSAAIINKPSLWGYFFNRNQAGGQADTETPTAIGVQKDSKSLSPFDEEFEDYVNSPPHP